MAETATVKVVDWPTVIVRLEGGVTTTGAAMGEHLRTSLLPARRKRLPAASTARRVGAQIELRLRCGPSTQLIVVTTPAGVILRINDGRLESLTNKLPAPSSATPMGS